MKKKALLIKILLTIVGIALLTAAVFLLCDRMFPKGFSDIVPNGGQLDSCQIICADGEKLLTDEELDGLVARLEQLQYYKQGSYGDVMEGNIYHAFFSAWEEETFVLHISDTGKIYTDTSAYAFSVDIDPKIICHYIEMLFQ